MKNRLTEIMKEKGIKAPKLAELANTTNQQIYRLMKGQRGMDIAWLERLAKALDVSPADLITDGKVKTTPGAAQSATVNVVVDASTACMAAINELKAQKQIPEGKAMPLFGKAMKYFWDDFATGKPPSPAAIKKFILSIAD